jgi:predicted nucleotidyltransferase
MSTISWHSDGPIIWREPLLKGLDRETYLSQLREKLQGRVQEAWLFGSLAKSDSEAFANDVDLILVLDTHEEFHRRALQFSDIAEMSTAADILVYTPGEWAKQSTEEGGFWGDVNRTRLRII